MTFGGKDTNLEPLEAAASALNVPLDLIDIAEPPARALYECDFVLVRPDHHVAWRGDSLPADAGGLIGKVSGNSL